MASEREETTPVLAAPPLPRQLAGDGGGQETAETTAALAAPRKPRQPARDSGGQEMAEMTAATISLWKLGWFFLKVGLVLYGSGYVLIAFLEGGLVQELGWLTQAQLLDAVAIGQFTPGPVLSTATFIGFMLDGIPGAVVATIGIFLPAFVFVALLNPWIPRLRSSKWLSAFLDAINASALALMAAVSIQIGLQVLISPSAIIITLLSALAIFRFHVSSVWIVAGGSVAGYVLSLLL